MSRPNLARLEPSAYTVLSVADPEKIATKTEQVLGELDLDHLCRLLVRSERSLSLVNRRSFAAALADVPALPNQALRPAPPFPEAVASAREDGKLLERTRQFLAQNPRALEELTPELTLALLRHFDPTMRMRPSPFTRHIMAVGSVTVIALVAAVLGILHTQQNDAITAKATEAQIAQIEREQHLSSAHAPRLVHQNEHAVAPPQISVKPAVAAVSVPPAPATSRPVVLAPVPTFHIHVPSAIAEVPVSPVVTKKYAQLFVPPVAAKPQVASAIAAPDAAHVQTASADQSRTAVPNSIAVPVSPAGATTVAPTSVPSSASSSSPIVTTGATAAGIVLHDILAQNPNANVEWIRANKASDHIVTVTTRVQTDDKISEETYQLYNSDGQLTVINHRTTTP